MTIENGYVAGNTTAPDAEGERHPVRGGLIHRRPAARHPDGDITSNTAQAEADSSGNGGTGKGGAIYISGVDVTIQNSKLAGNTVYGGDATGTSFLGGNGDGGAVFETGKRTILTQLTVSLTTISGNKAYGGDLTVDSSVTNSVMPTAGTGDAGGIYFSAGYTSGTRLVSITDTEIDSNQAFGGNTTNIYGVGDSWAGDGIAGGIDVLTTHPSGNITAEAIALNSTLSQNDAYGGNVTITNEAVVGPTRAATGMGRKCVYRRRCDLENRQWHHLRKLH